MPLKGSRKSGIIAAGPESERRAGDLESERGPDEIGKDRGASAREGTEL